MASLIALMHWHRLIRMLGDMQNNVSPAPPPTTLGDLARGRHNNLDLVRLACAGLVLFGHGYIIFTNDPSDPDPVASFLYGAQAVGLNVFFVLSGFLIARSALQSTDAVAFWTARGARIVPGLVVASAFCALLIGPIATESTLQSYFRDPSLALYILGTGFFTLPDLRLPGVFENAPNPGDVNISVWTLRYEVALYVAAWGAASCGLLTKRSVFLVIAVAIGYAATMESGLYQDIPTAWHVFRFGTAFGLGAFAWLHRSRIVMSWTHAFGLTILAASLHDTALGPILALVASGYLALMLGYAAPVIGAYHRVGDLSYGVYIYHWPIGSLLYATVPGITPLALTAVTAVLSLPAAYASWRFVEAPALSLVRNRRRDGETWTMPGWATR